jgi:Kef-type K+ transport system membrane component KefB
VYAPGIFLDRTSEEMLPFLQLIIVIVVIISAAKLGGYLSYRLGQPTVLGELLAGLLLGPTVADFLHLPFITDTHLAETIHSMAEIGVLLLMFIAGLDLHLSDLAKSGRVSAAAGFLGFVTPVAMGAGTALLFSYDLQPAIFLGLILAATSVSISAQTLIELKMLRTRVGISLLGAAVVDDILVVLGLSLFVALVLGGSSNGILEVGVILLRMVLFLVVSVLLGFRLLPGLSRRMDKLPISQGLIAFVFVVLLLYAWSAEVIGGMAAITGSFLAGLSFANSPVKPRIHAGISSLAYGVFVPIFFVNIGLSANLRSVGGELWLFFLTICVVAVVSKLLGAGLGGLLGGLSRGEALGLGMGMISRGEVGLIVASVGMLEGLIDSAVFSTVVGMVIVTTLLTPPLLRAVLTRQKKTAPPQAADL